MNIEEVLGKFCGSEFWNSSLSWHTENPDLTICFEKTVLVLIPCSVLWIFSVIEIFHILKSRKKCIPWNWRNVSKLLVIVTLCVITVMELLFDISHQEKLYPVDVVFPLVKLSSFILVFIFIIYNRKKGIRSSGVQFFFWFILAVCGIFQLRTEIKNLQIKHLHSYPSYLFYTIHYSFVLLLLFLSSLNDRPVKDSIKKNKNICPEEECSFLSRLFFSWIETLAWKGFRKPLTDEDLYDLRDQDSARHVVVNFDYHWTKKLHRRKKLTNPKVSVLPICLEAFLSTFIFGILLKFSSDLLAFVNPQILSLLINFVKHGEEHWKGYFYAVLLLSTGVIKSLLSVQYSHKANVIGLRIRVALNSIIYRKALKLSSRARRNYTIGEIVNLISNDTKNIADLPPNLISVISAIIQVIMSLYFLWEILGIAVFSGLIVMILMIPISSFISNKLKTLQIKKMKSSDQRIKQTNEVLNNFKVLKLYAWEPIFHSNILKVRETECQYLKNSVFYNVGYSFVWLCAPFLVSLVCFATYVLIDDKNILDAQVAFVSLSLFNILRVPMNTLPATLSNIVQASVSLVRVNKMLSNDELDPADVTHHDDSFPLTIKNGVFGWGEEPILKNINISLPKSSLTAIVGSVGSGKSTLLSAFLGETHKFAGQVNTSGNIAYVPQQAWIQNATLRNNILFGKPYDRLKYQRVVSACALKSDFEALPGGDNTEIGEKGVNLSGGQRQRISLARAVYADADIYFLDDPLSAVDTRVGRHIFEKVIGPNGILKSKTRVFVTHGITYLPRTDKVIVMRNGVVSECGTYQQLLDKKGDFSDFLMNHLNEDSDEYSKQQLLCHQKTELGVESLQMSVMSYDKLLLSSQDNLLDDSRLTDIEKLETGSVGWDIYKFYLGTIGWRMISAAIVSNFFMHLLNIGCKVWLSIWSTDPTMVNNGTNDHNKTLFYLGVYSTFGFGKSLLGIFAVLAPQIGGVNAAIKLHQGLLHRIVHAPMSFFDTTPTGRLLSRFAKDIGTVDYKLAMYLYEGINSFFIVIGTLIVTSYTAPVFIAVIIPLGLVYYLIQKFYIETSRQLKRLEAISRSPIYSLFNESIAGAPVIRAFKADLTFTNDFEKKCDFNNSCYYLSMISNRWMSLRLEILGNLIVFFSVMFSVTVKHLNAGLLGLSITYALEITETLNYLVRIASEVETNIVSVERIREYTQAPQEASWDNPDVYVRTSWPDKGVVEFRKFGVRYRPGLELVLKNVSFQTQQNEKIGIVGRTGAGKSSLTLSLFRILEAAEGEILIDGVNLATLGLQTLRSRITIIPQDAVLFSGTLRLNLDPYNKYTDNEIWQTLEHAHLKSFIQTFPEGLEYLVSEDGDNFSLGQKQLICLGRALLRKTKVLILDEATAAVDLETDNLIQNTIRNEFRECTVLTIAHRLNTILDYDRVIVLNKGTIEEFDSPTCLLKNKGSFYSMCKDAGITQ